MPRPPMDAPRSPEPIATPCVRVCSIEPLSGLCIGCGRTLKEIGAWSGLSREMRRAIMASLAARLARLRTERPEAFGDGPPDEGHAVR